MEKLNNKVVCRPIQEEELELIMQWRMREDITKYMYTDPKLTLEGQKEWLARIKKDPHVIYWMIEVDDIPSGVLNISDIDKRNKRCGWGIYIAVKEKRSLELMMRIEWNIYDYAFEKLGMHKVCGEVMSLNKGVIRIHQMCGSEKEGILKDHILKNGTFYDVALLGICEEKWREVKKKYTYEPIIFR